MSNSTKTIRPFKNDVRVKWADDCRPSAVSPLTRGRVFLSKGRQTWVIWGDESRPVVVFTGALVLA